jgi:hypothetical protein
MRPERSLSKGPIDCTFRRLAHPRGRLEPKLLKQAYSHHPLNHADCSVNRAKCSLNHAACSLNHLTNRAVYSPNPCFQIPTLVLPKRIPDQVLWDSLLCFD